MTENPPPPPPPKKKNGYLIQTHLNPIVKANGAGKSNTICIFYAWAWTCHLQGVLGVCV